MSDLAAAGPRRSGSAGAGAALAEAARRLGALCRFKVPIGPLTTYRVGGAAALFVEVRDEATLERLVAVTTTLELPLLVLGRGSNLLVADRGFDGLCLRLSGDFAGADPAADPASAGSAVALPALSRRSVAAGRTGLEWAVGVPGSVGGGVRMNAGGHGACIADILVDADVLDLTTGDRRLATPAALALSYRHSSITATDLVLGARFALREGDRALGAEQLEQIVRWRREHQPGGQNAGSVFTNPPGDSAGRLLELAGCRGLRIGSAEVSAKHANFIQADRAGTAADVVRLIDACREMVLRRCEVELATELQLVGFSPEAGR
jgi:UDP-N-acetylmuramate dehydrogenase